MKFYALTIFSFLFLPILNSQVVLEKDINQEAASSHPFYFAELNNALYFRANDGIHGDELMKYDISTQAVSLVADIRPYEAGSGINGVFEFDDKIYFAARDGNGFDHHLIVHDPADNSTQRLVDVNNVDAEDPFHFYEFNGELFFTAIFSGVGSELARYNPTTNEFKISDFNPDGGSNPNSYVEANGKLWFSADDGQGGSRLWNYDPATDQFQKVEYNDPNGLSPNFQAMEYFDGKFFFPHYIQGSGSELGRYDLATNTVMDLILIYPGAGSGNPNGFTEFNGKLYFKGRSVSEGQELRVYDPATEQVTVVAEMNPDGEGGIGELNILDGKLYFTAVTDNIDPQKLFSLSANNTITEEASLNNYGNPNYLSSLLVFNNILYMDGTVVDNGTELYQYTPGGDITLAADINQNTIGSDPYDFVEYNGKLFFGADEINTGRQIWFYDPGTGEVELLSEFSGFSSPNGFTVHQGKLYFSGVHPDDGYGLLVYDDATGEINPTSYLTPNASGHISDITSYNDKIYFRASADPVDDELFAYDPSNNTYAIVTDINPNGRSKPERMYVHQNELFFQAEDEVNGRELWKYNDVTGFYALVNDINPGEEASNPDNFLTYAGELYFRAYNSETSYELYSYNSTTGVLTRRTDVTGGLDPRNFAIYKDRLFFSGRYSPSTNAELVYYDAATEELVLTEDLSSSGSNPRDLVVLDDKLYFSTWVEEYGRELWQYNDTTLSIVADIYSGVPESNPEYLTFFNDKIYFSANDGTRGAEIWSIAECLNVFVSTEPQVNSDGVGAIDLTVQGGLPPYTISWSNGASSEDISNLQSGEYTAVVSDASGCLSEITAQVAFLSVSTEDLIEDENVLLFPNPNSGRFTLDIGKLEVEAVEVFDKSGRLFYQKMISSTSSKIDIQLRYAPAGVYFLKIRTPEGVLQKKVILK